jgi:hypothetical protein
MRPGNSLILIFAAALALAGCREKSPEAVVSETRKLTTKDALPKLDATDAQRFTNAAPSPLRGLPPENWLAVPATQFRLLNYRFGTSGSGEVFVSVAGGSVLENANRWLGQFKAPLLTSEGLAALEKLPVLGGEGVWLEASGTYASGMGQPPRDGYALAGVLAMAGERLVTVKMVGPAAEVAAERERLRAFASSLSLVE